MKTEQRLWRLHSGWLSISDKQLQDTAQLVLAFGSREALTNPERYQELRKFYPTANILCSSTSGEILGSQVYDNSIVVTAIYFEKTSLKVAHTTIANMKDSYAHGKKLLEELQSKDLNHLFVLSDGHLVNGSELVKGLSDSLVQPIPTTGGLAGDGSLFQRTLVGLNEPPSEGKIVAVGFYGKNLKVGHGSKGGWDSFGPERIVTRSEGNVLYEVDGQSALELYKKYLGQYAQDLPMSALLFPLSLKLAESNEVLVRTVLSVDEQKKCMIFAGDIPEGSYVQLMRANFDRLIDGAISAADHCLSSINSFTPELAILISCVGRKLVLSHRIEEEVEEAKRILGEGAAIVGFYSYGEISPLVKSAKCELHNQTMTITAYQEV